MNTSAPTAPSFFPTRKDRRLAAPFVPFKPVSARTVIWSVLLGIGVITPLAVGLGLLHLPESAGAAAAAQQRWTYYAAHPGALFLKAVIVMPLLEEVFYRGILLQLLRRYCPLWFAVAFTSVFFGLTHLGTSVATAANACILGVVFSWLVIRTRSLWASLLCHAAINFAWLFLINPGFGLLEKMVGADAAHTAAPHPLTVYPAWWLVLSVALSATAVVMLRKSNPPPTSA